MNFLPGLFHSAEEKRQTQIDAYLDGLMSPQKRQQFERQMAQDSALQTGVRRQQAIQAALRALPAQKAPRSFALDPAVYGAVKPQSSWNLFPALQLGTTLAAFLLVTVLSFTLLQGGAGGAGQLAEPVAMQAPAADVAMEEAAPMAAGEVVAEVEVTRVVAEEVVVEEEAAPAAIETAAEALAEAEVTAEQATKPSLSTLSEPTESAGSAGGEPAAAAPLTLSATPQVVEEVQPGESDAAGVEDAGIPAGSTQTQAEPTTAPTAEKGSERLALPTPSVFPTEVVPTLTSPVSPAPQASNGRLLNAGISLLLGLLAAGITFLLIRRRN